MFQIRSIDEKDKSFWYSLDRHLPEAEFNKKVADKRGYIILDNEKPIGVMRYNMFWDNTPFLTLIYIDFAYHKKGYGRKAMDYWEKEMSDQGFKLLMTSTQADDNAQHFYRNLGYNDCGCLVLDLPGFEQPLEMFMVKAI